MPTIKNRVSWVWPYSRVVQAVKFNADGTGTWWKMMFSADDASKPLALFGGRYLENGTFDYSVAADGTIRAKRRGEKGQDGSPMALVFHYQDGAITFGDGIAAQTMKPAPEDYDNLLLALENSQGRKWQRGLCKCQPALVQRNGDKQPADGFLRRHNA